MSISTSPDRRQRRHQETATEVVAVAVGVMTEAGAAGMTLGEVARRMGIRTPSLYVYFPSKAALCDEIFARGWREVGELVSEYDGQLNASPEPLDFLRESMATFVTWAVDHPAYSQLMFWRPVPNWEPSADAYQPAIENLERMTGALRKLQSQGAIRADADLDEATGAWTTIVSGLISQQLANEPNIPARSGRFRALIDPLVEMFLAQYDRKAVNR